MHHNFKDIDALTDEERDKISPEKILVATKSLYNFKVALRRFLVKHAAAAMTEDDYRTASAPLALRAFKDGRNSMLNILDPYLGE